MRVIVIDGQGGGIGKLLVEKLRRALPGEEVEIIALGTNAVATAAMLKAGANDGATGENAVVQTVSRADVVVGTLSVVVAHGMMGEITPAMAEAVARSPASKILLHLNRAGVEIVGASAEPLPHLVDMLVERVKTHLYQTDTARGKAAR
ncbi:MAG: hypothetical protein XD69_0701 [Clostridia bacterium 62_21]|nr:MAG: hypothetical protein XD69_0701 [Clostridia bacterium 62_21]HAG06984.1 hypothetical protein [Peptococcaceae bacterium]